MNRNAIIKHVELWQTKLGSMSAVARKCGISPASLSTILSGTYGADENAMLQKLAHALDYKESNWTIVRSIHNYRTLATVFSDAKTESMWFCVSNPAGSSKTCTFEDIFNLDHSGSYTFIQAEEWSARQFLIKLVKKTMGEKALDGRYKTIAQLTDMLAGYFNEKSLERPVLVIDEADKLRPAALRQLIPLFNRTEDRLGLILSGTENLEKEIRAGVRLHKKGYDELESRFGRTYITLRGASQKEVYEICSANGLQEEEAQARIWGELEKRGKQTTVKTQTGFRDIMVEYAEDFRKIKRLIKRELLSKNRKAIGA